MRIRTPSPFPDLQPVPSRLIISFLLYILSCFPIPFWSILHHFQFPIPLLRFYPLKPILLIHSSSSSTPPPPLLSPLHPFSIFPSLHSRIFKYPLSSPLSFSTSSPFPPTTFPTQCLRGLTLGVVPHIATVPPALVALSCVPVSLLRTCVQRMGHPCKVRLTPSFNSVTACPDY